MAKYNMFLGKAVGSVGDVVFSQYNGKQVARSRNRSPRNPNSNAQRVQRAVMASVLRAYSAGKVILDHSFEGQSVGLGNMKRFLKLNLNKLRTAVLADLAAGSTGAACQGRVTGPEVNEFVPFPFIVSEGSLSQDAFDAKLCAPEGTTLSTWISQNAIRKDDIFTCIVYQCLSPDTQYNTAFIAPGATDYYGKVGRSHFSYLQLKVKDLSSLTEQVLDSAVDDVSYDTIFDVVAFDGIDFDASISLTTGILTGDTLPLEGSYYASGVIRSRESSGQRSACVLEYPTDIQGWAAEFGLTSDYLIAAWDKDAKSAAVDPMLILEGSNFSLAPSIEPVVPLTFDGAQYFDAEGVIQDWPSAGNTRNVNGKQGGSAIEFRIGVVDDYTLPVSPSQVSSMKIMSKLSSSATWEEWGSVDTSGMNPGDVDYFVVSGNLPASLQTGVSMMFAVYVNGVQDGGTVAYSNLV